MLSADKMEPLGGVHNPYDFGWIMRPVSKNPSTWDLLEPMDEDLSNPLAATLRRETSMKEQKPNGQETDLPEDN